MAIPTRTCLPGRHVVESVFIPDLEAGRAIELYTTSEYREWNRRLRAEEPLGDDARAVDALSEALRNAPKYEGTVYRRMYFETKEQMDAFLGELVVGEPTKFAGFTSTSTEPEKTRTFTGDFNVDMTVKSQRGVYLGDMAVMKNEREVLFDRDTSFIVRSVEVSESGAQVVMEEIGP